MKYNICYKYLELSTDTEPIVIEVSFDNTIGKGCFAASTNIELMDDDGDLVSPCGIGSSEELALDMCIEELREKYPTLNEYNINAYKRWGNINYNDIREILLPYKVTIDTKKTLSTFYYKEQDDQLCILLDSGKITLPKEKTIIDTFEKNIKLLSNSNSDVLTKDYLIANDFYPTFEELTM